MKDGRGTLRIRYVGGPTAILELGGARFLTDPTFDPAESDYPTPHYTLRKRTGPLVGMEDIGSVDAVLLSHDHHPDNLDRAGRTALKRAGKVVTTKEGAGRLGGNSIGLAPWERVEILPADGPGVVVTATPARHGPEGGDRGPVIGFVLARAGIPGKATYVSGDTVLFEGVVEVGRRFDVGVAVLFMGAAKVAAAGSSHLTFTAKEAVEAARVFPGAAIVPLHYEGWEHFSETRAAIEREFRSAGLAHRLRWAGPAGVEF